MTDDACSPSSSPAGCRTLAGPDRCDDRGRRGAVPRQPVSLPVLGRGPVGPRPPPDEPGPGMGLADVLWALINTREFVLNH